MDILQSPPEISYFEMMPTDVLIPIFNNLDLADVMKCENISQQTQEAAANYYRKKFSKLIFNSDNLSGYARCNDQESKLSFARAMFRAIGPYIKFLEINYPTFCINWVRPLSEIIREYCTNLTKVYITGTPNHRITMVNTRNVEKMHITNCLFDNQAIMETSSKLSCLRYQSVFFDSIPSLDKLLRQYPCIRHLIVYINLESMEELQSIASLTCLTDLLVIILPGYTEYERQVQKSNDFSKFFTVLQRLPNLVIVNLVIPFFMRISHEILDTSVKALRHKCEVRLTATINYYPYVEPEQIISLRDDLDGLDGIIGHIKFVQPDMLMSLSPFVRLRILVLMLCGKLEEFGNHQIVGVLAALVDGARKQDCFLKIVRLYPTTRVGVEHLPSIVEFLRVAKELKELRIYNCTSELIKYQTLMQTEKVVIVFK